MRFRIVRTHTVLKEAELHEFLAGHLCRCTGYVAILAAALDAAKSCTRSGACLISEQLSRQRGARPRRAGDRRCDLRLTYAQWYARISALVAGFDRSA